MAFRPIEPARLLVRVNDEFVLDAGARDVSHGPRGLEVLIRPPTTALVH